MASIQTCVSFLQSLTTQLTLGSIRSLLITFAPFIIPRLISYYRSIKAQSQNSPVPIRPTPIQVRYAINILFVAATLALISTLPTFSPDNVFSLTSSRLQTPSEVLFNRLASVRAGKTLTDLDGALKNRLASLDGRCLYLTYGPYTTAECLFCNSDDPDSFLYYAMPSIFFPYVLNLFAVGLATSSAVCGKEGGRWRTLGTLAGSVIAVADVYLFYVHDWKANARVLYAEELVPFYWRMRVFRGIVIALVDAGLAGLLWGSSTNRIFVVPVSSAERLENVTRTLESTRGKLGAVGIVRNVTVRSDGLKKKAEAYWQKEREFMGEVMDEREVVESVKSALGSGRVSVQRIEEEARRYAESIIGYEGSATTS